MTRPGPQKHPTASHKLATDSCGCAMGARFLGLALLASIGWFGWHWRDYSLAGAGVRGLIIVFAATTIGKLVGIALYRIRTRRTQQPFPTGGS